MFKPPKGRKVSKNALLNRFTKFAQRQWLDLLTQSVAASAAAIEMRSRRRTTGTDSVEKRAERAEALICLGEISAARRALEASGTEATHRALTDVRQRPPELRDTIPDVILESELVHPFEMDEEMFLQNLRTARRGGSRIRHAQ